MGRFFRLNPVLLSEACARRILAIIWLCGLLFGTLFSLLNGASNHEVIRSVLHSRVSFFGLFSALILPLLITALFVYLSKPHFIFLLVFLKAFAFASIGSGFLYTFNSSSWLIRCFAMFSDILILPILWYFWLQAFTYQRDVVLRLIPAPGIAILSVCYIDCFCVTPFWTNLL